MLSCKVMCKASVKLQGQFSPLEDSSMHPHPAAPSTHFLVFSFTCSASTPVLGKKKPDRAVLWIFIIYRKGGRNSGDVSDVSVLLSRPDCQGESERLLSGVCPVCLHGWAPRLHIHAAHWLKGQQWLAACPFYVFFTWTPQNISCCECTSFPQEFFEETPLSIFSLFFDKKAKLTLPMPSNLYAPSFNPSGFITMFLSSYQHVEVPINEN